MIPLKLYVKNAIGIKKGLGLDELTIDFTQYQHGIVGIVGDTGSGKTVIVEMCTPYTKLITRDGSIQSHFYGNDALKEFTFEFNGKTYLSRFIINADKNKIKPFIYEIIDGEENVLNDKISEYNAIVEKLFGPFETFVHSIFAPQGDFPIISLSDGELKKLFISLFNINKYNDVYIPYVKEKYTLIDNDIRVKRILIDKYQEDISKEEEVKNNISVLEKELNELKEHFDAAGVEKKSIEDRINKIEMEIQSNEHTAQLIELNKKRYKEEQDRLIQFDKDYKQKINNIEVGLSSNDKYINELRARLKNASDNAQRYIKIVDNVELIKEKYKTLHWLQVEYTSIEDKIKKQSEIKNRIINLENEYKITEQKILHLEDENKMLGNQTGVIQEVPCHGTEMSNSCKLLAGAFKANDIIADNKKEISVLKNKLSSLSGEIAQLKTQIDDNIDNKFNSLKKEIDTLKAEKWDRLYDEIETALVEVDKFNSINNEINRKIKATEQSSVEIRDSLKNIELSYQKRRSEILDNINHIKEEINKYTVNDPAKYKEQVNKLNFELVNINMQINNLNKQIVDIVSQINMYKNSLKDIEKKKKEQYELADGIKNELDKYNSYKKIEKFLKDMPVIEIKALSKSLKKYTNELLENMFEYGLSIDFITEMDKAGGKGKKDVFKIIVFNNGDEMLGKNLSGGQKQIVDMAIRMAIETIFYNISSRQFKTVFMDESDSGLDTERAIKFWDMVEKTHEMNSRYYTFIITHRTEIKNNIDQIIDLNAWRN